MKTSSEGHLSEAEGKLMIDLNARGRTSNTPQIYQANDCINQTLVRKVTQMAVREQRVATIYPTSADFQRILNALCHPCQD